MPDSNLILAAVAVAAAVYLLARGRTGVAEHERLAVFRLGRCIGQRGPGTAFSEPPGEQIVRGGRPSRPEVDIARRVHSEGAHILGVPGCLM
jgi:regulator of protease activity HflC (stomatin/prohibitin superfamily)